MKRVIKKYNSEGHFMGDLTPEQFCSELKINRHGFEVCISQEGVEWSGLGQNGSRYSTLECDYVMEAK